MASEMAAVLHKLRLDHFIDKFSSEKITPDLVGKLSFSDFWELEAQSRGKIMKLWMECSKYGLNKPPRNMRHGCRAPVFEIPWSVLDCYLEQNLKIEEISKILSVSESTIYRRMRQYGLSKMEFSDVSPGDLDQVVSDITKEFPHSGEGLIKQILLTKNIKVQRWQLCESLHRVDSEGFAK